MRAVFAVLAVAVVALAAGCPSGRLSPQPDEPSPPAPGIVAPIGDDASLDVGAWNLKNFPCGNDSGSDACRATSADTPALVASLVGALDVDLLAVEEIDDEDAFHQMVAAIPDRAGILSTHTYFDGTYQKVGFVYKESVLTAGPPALLFEGDFAFPRPPLAVHFTWTGPGAPLDFVAVAVHLKAGVSSDDSARRKDAIAALESWARELVDSGQASDIVILGDFNEKVTDGAGRANFAPFADAARYDIRTEPAADDGAVTFLPSGAMIDHIVTTSAVAPAVGDGGVVLERLDDDVDDYLGRVSDHLPVFLRLAAP